MYVYIYIYIYIYIFIYLYNNNNNNNNNNFILCSIIKLCPHQKAYNMHARERKCIKKKPEQM